MDQYIRYKRKNRSIYQWDEKLYVPVTLSTKNEFTRAARLNCCSQAELGAVVVMHYLANPELLAKAIAAYREAEANFQSDHRDRLENRFTKPSEVDRTFGGKFKSTFGDDDEVES